jgi:hypothetical protein
MSSRDPRRVDTSTNAARKRQNAAHVMACPPQFKLRLPGAVHKQLPSQYISRHPTSRPSSSQPWPPQLQTLTPISSLSTSLTSTLSINPSEIITGSQINVVTRTSKPYLVMPSARKPPSCQRKITAVLPPPIQTSPAHPPTESLRQQCPLPVPSSSPISHRHRGTYRSWFWREI